MEHITSYNKKIVETYLKAFVESYGYKPDRYGRYHCLHPNHEDRHPSMSIFIGQDGKPRIRCHSCATVYDIYNLVELFVGIKGFKEQYKFIYKYFGLNYYDPNPYNGYSSVRETITTDKLSNFFNNCCKNSDVWEERGISKVTQDAYNLLYNKYERSLVIPIKSKNGKYLGYIQRLLNSDIKYKKSQGLVSIFNLTDIDIKKPLIITEGEIDALSIIECQYSNVISIGGVTYVKKWLHELMKLNPIKIISAFDLDKAGYNATSSCATICKDNACSYVNIWKFILDKKMGLIKDINDVLLLDKPALMKAIERSTKVTCEKYDKTDI